MINIEDFNKVEIKIGEILSAEKVPNADKLLKLSVDFGQIPVPEEKATETVAVSVAPATLRDVRQIISGIALYLPDPTTLVGRKCAFSRPFKDRLKSIGQRFD